MITIKYKRVEGSEGKYGMHIIGDFRDPNYKKPRDWKLRYWIPGVIFSTSPIWLYVLSTFEPAWYIAIPAYCVPPLAAIKFCGSFIGDCMP